MLHEESTDSKDKHEVTELLIRWGGGDEAAFAELLPQVYDVLCRIAHNYMNREKPGHTLETGALINEAYVKLIDQSRVDWMGRSHFFAIAAITMRRILFDHANARNAQRRGGKAVKVPLDDVLHNFEEKQKVEFIELHEAFRELEKLDKHLARVVELRFFGGLTIEETAEVLNISKSKVKADWETARTWLYRRLKRKF
jgi:RNA polymerase sigma factor (TIGR02999 family)